MSLRCTTSAASSKPSNRATHTTIIINSTLTSSQNDTESNTTHTVTPGVNARPSSVYVGASMITDKSMLDDTEEDLRGDDETALLDVSMQSSGHNSVTMTTVSSGDDESDRQVCVKPHTPLVMSGCDRNETYTSMNTESNAKAVYSSSEMIERVIVSNDTHIYCTNNDIKHDDVLNTNDNVKKTKATKRNRVTSESSSSSSSSSSKALDKRIHELFNFHLKACAYAKAKGCAEHPNCIDRLRRGMKACGVWRPHAVQIAECLNESIPAASNDGDGEPRELRYIAPTGFLPVLSNRDMCASQSSDKESGTSSSSSTTTTTRTRRNTSNISSSSSSFSSCATTRGVSTALSKTSLPAGLINLGMTCYLNSYLQCLFFNFTFRNIVYQCVPSRVLPCPLPDPRTYDTHAPTDGELVLAHLQLLFARMQCGSRASLSPIHLVRLLGLAVSHQQDIQEFTHLFLTCLSHAFKASPNAAVQSLVNDEFRGTLVHTTKCCRCRSQSNRSAHFFELNLPINSEHSSLEQSILDYLREERLSGLNRYHCEQCADKCNATRALRLLHLPPMLHIQLMRFVYDKKTHTKRKLHCLFDVPHVLYFCSDQLSGDTQQSAAECNEQQSVMSDIIYDLYAVVSHTGETTHSGHYTVDLRCDERGGQWIRFNDDVVTPISSHTIGCTTSDNRTIPSGRSLSRNAYMLLYSRRGRPLERCSRPSSLMLQRVREENKWLHRRCAALDMRKNLLHQFVQQRRADVDRFWTLVRLNDHVREANGEERGTSVCDNDCYVVSERWCSSWLRGQRLDGRNMCMSDDQSLEHTCPGPVINQDLCCEHGGLNPCQRKSLVIVSSQMWKLLSKLGYDVELRPNQACIQCSLELLNGVHEQNNLAKKPRIYNFTKADVTQLRILFKRRRVYPGTQPPRSKSLFMVPIAWVEKVNQWLKLICPSSSSSSSSSTRLTNIDSTAALTAYPGPISTDSLLCRHQLLAHSLRPTHHSLASDNIAIAKNVMFGTTPEDWKLLCRFFSISQSGAIHVSVSNIDPSKTSLCRSWDAITTVSTPAWCETCCNQSIRTDESSTHCSYSDNVSSLALFESGELMIRRVSHHVGAPVVQSDSTNSGTNTNRTRSMRTASKITPVQHEVVFTVNVRTSLCTVVELKAKIEAVSGIPVASQKLFVEQCALQPDTSTLRALSLKSNAIVCLEIDSSAAADHDEFALRDIGDEEIGFFGTGLHKAVKSKPLEKLNSTASMSSDTTNQVFWVPNLSYAHTRKNLNSLSKENCCWRRHLPCFMRLCTTLAASMLLAPPSSP